MILAILQNCKNSLRVRLQNGPSGWDHHLINTNNTFELITFLFELDRLYLACSDCVLLVEKVRVVDQNVVLQSCRALKVWDLSPVSVRIVAF